MFISVIGPKGFVGNNIVKFLNEKKCGVLKIDKKFKFKNVPDKYNIIIHSANSSKKYEAEDDPVKDYNLSVKLTKKISKIFKKKKIILISTISARTEKNIYALNRKKCEDIILKSSPKKNLVFRLPILFNNKLKRGILYDLIKNKKIYLSKNCLVNPISIQEICEYIYKNLNSKKRIHEIGSKNKLSLFKLSKLIGSKSKFGNKNVNLLSNYKGNLNYDNLVKELKSLKKK